jgi:hypothetical protein
MYSKQFIGWVLLPLEVRRGTKPSDFLIEEINTEKRKNNE